MTIDSGRESGLDYMPVSWCLLLGVWLLLPVKPPVGVESLGSVDCSLDFYDGSLNAGRKLAHGKSSN